MFGFCAVLKNLFRKRLEGNKKNKKEEAESVWGLLGSGTWREKEVDECLFLSYL